MLETIDIPRNELFAFKKRNGLTAKQMAWHFGVPATTMDGWLYRQGPRAMLRTSYDSVMRKLAESNIFLSEPEFVPRINADLPPIASAIKGDAEECWLHYVSEVYPCCPEEKKIIIAYTRVQEGTLRRWLNLMMPEGQNLLRLRCLLGHRGYGVAELEALNSALRALSYVIADWKMPISEVIHRLNYKKEGALLQVLLGREKGISDERLEKCRKLVVQHSGETIKEQEKIPVCGAIDRKVGQNEKIPILFITKPDREEAASSIRRVNGTCQWEVENLAAMIRIMLPLAERALSDEYTDKDRERLRTLTNGDGVFRLSTALNGLCGPRMRARVMNKQEGE